MSAALDPIVARALDQLVPGVDPDPEVILERARVAAQGMKRRRAKRLRRTAVLAFAALVLFASAAVAADHFDLFAWLDQSNRSSASYSVDNSRTYRGSAPEILICPKAGARLFTCSLGYYPTSNRRAYLLSGRVEAQPHASREFYLRSLATFERNGSVDRAKAERFRHDLAAVGDDFLAALNVLGDGMTISGGPTFTEGEGEGQNLHARPGYEFVPPAGVPMFIACESAGNGARCHDLASSREVPVGTPYYFLQSSPDWVEIPRESQKLPDTNHLFHVVLGRDVTPAEAQFMFDLATTGESHSSGQVHELPTKPPAPRQGSP